MRQGRQVIGGFQQGRIAQWGEAFLALLNLLAGGVYNDFLGRGKKTAEMNSMSIDLSPLISEDELDGIAVALGGRDDLGRNPGMVLVFEPDAGPFAVYVFGHV